MSAIASARPPALQNTQGSRVVAVVTRLPMVALTAILLMVALRYLITPVQAAAAAGISFASPGGITVARIGFAAFPLAFVALFLGSLFSPRRLLSGLRTELLLLAVVVGVRLLGMVLAHSSETATLLIPEVVLALLCMFAIRLENRRKRDESV
ncbi:MAG: hypothetical protein JO356_02340 [Acidobacteria bacterium]|nr:hypothetical protein [Acidobacteriota bacterium]